MDFGEKQPQYVDNGGAVRYLSASSLERPFSLPRKFYALAGAFVLVAAVAGGVFLNRTVDAAINAPQRAQEQLEQNLARNVSYDIPAVSSLIALDDAAIRQSFSDAGLTMYDLSTPEDNPHGGFDSVKLPEDVSLNEAAAMYATGVGKLSGSDAAKLLKGSWTINVARKDYNDMRIRYCDFESGDVETAVQNAMVQQGLDQSVIGESGIDDAGNTYVSGVVDVDGTFYPWRVSACALSAVYDYHGFPEDGVYVGIRITQ